MPCSLGLGSVAAACLGLMPITAAASDIVVAVSGITSDTGEIGCALFGMPRGFPLDTSAAVTQWRHADRGGVTCRFERLNPGSYAVAVGHDLNGNHRTDTNWLGIPTEPWGVSNNVRPTLRAPRFEEAAVQLAAGAAVTINVRVAP